MIFRYKFCSSDVKYNIVENMQQCSQFELSTHARSYKTRHVKLQLIRGEEQDKYLADQE